MEPNGFFLQVSKELIKLENHHPTHQFKMHCSMQKPTRWNDCGRNPKQRWSAWRTSWPLWESAGPSSPGSQTTLLLTHAPTPGTCRHTGTTVWFKTFICKRQEEAQKKYIKNNKSKLWHLTVRKPSIYDPKTTILWWNLVIYVFLMYSLSVILPVYSDSCFLTALNHFGKYVCSI